MVTRSASRSSTTAPASIPGSAASSSCRSERAQAALRASASPRARPSWKRTAVPSPPVTPPAAAPASPSPSRSVAESVIMVVEDEHALRRALAASLTAEGYWVEAIATGAAALQAISDAEPDVVLLDLGLPDLDGVEVCRQLRRWSTVPIIVVTADGAEDRKVRALDEGADDYLTKPFSVRELLARVRVAVRHRRAMAAVIGEDKVEVGDLAIDVAAHEATVGGRPIALTRKGVRPPHRAGAQRREAPHLPPAADRGLGKRIACRVPAVAHARRARPQEARERAAATGHRERCGRRLPLDHPRRWRAGGLTHSVKPWRHGHHTVSKQWRRTLTLCNSTFTFERD